MIYAIEHVKPNAIGQRWSLHFSSETRAADFALGLAYGIDLQYPATLQLYLGVPNTGQERTEQFLGQVDVEPITRAIRYRRRYQIDPI